MRCAIGSLLAGIDLHHAGDIERVDSREGICCNQHDTRVCVDLLLQVAQLDGLEHCALLVCLPRSFLLYAVLRTSRLVQMGQVGQVIASFEHRRVHERGQVRVVAGLDGGQSGLDGF